MAVDANILREKLAEILRDEHYTVAGLARSMNLAPETLEAWLDAGKRHCATPPRASDRTDATRPNRASSQAAIDTARIERIVSHFIAARETFWNAIKQGDARAHDELKTTLVLGLAETLSRLVRAAGCSHEAELLEAAAHVLLRDLEQLAKAAPACNEVSCWRCGATIFPPPRDIAEEIEKNMPVAEASGWDADTFRLRCREKMAAGDRIVRFGLGAVVVRRPDKTQFVVRRLDG